MCLGLATGFIRKPQMYKYEMYEIVVNDYKLGTQFKKKIFASNVWQALRKAQIQYPAPDYAIVSVMEV